MRVIPQVSLVLVPPEMCRKSQVRRMEVARRSACVQNFFVDAPRGARPLPHASGGITLIRRHPSASFVASAAFALCLPVASSARGHRETSSPSFLPAPIAIYSHIPASAGSLPSNQPGEAVVMSQLAEVARLKKAGVRFDYDMVDALWFLNSGFRMGPTAAWPNGPGAWIDRCRNARILPGLRFGGNTLGSKQSISSLPPEWKTSLGQSNRSLSLFEGGFLPGMISAMQSWHDRGILSLRARLPRPRRGHSRFRGQSYPGSDRDAQLLGVARRAFGLR